MGKIVKLRISERMLLKRSMEEAQKEFELLFKLTDGQPGLAPPWLLGMDEETYQKWYDGDIEI